MQERVLLLSTPNFTKEPPFQQSHQHFDQQKCVTSVMKGKFDRWVFFSPLSKKTSPGLMLKAKKPYLLCQKGPSTLMADLLRVQRQVMAHMVPLKRCSVYKCQRTPVLYNDDNFQDWIYQNTEHFWPGINVSERQSQLSSFSSFTLNWKAMQGGRQNTHQGSDLGGKSWVLCKTHCRSHGNCTHAPHNQAAQDSLPVKVEPPQHWQMVRS